MTKPIRKNPRSRKPENGLVSSCLGGESCSSRRLRVANRELRAFSPSPRRLPIYRDSAIMKMTEVAPMQTAQHKDKKEFRDSLEAAILYLYGKAPSRQSQTKIQKMLFYADWLHFQKHGYTVTRSPFLMHFYGPFSEKVRHAIEGLEVNGILETVSYTSDAGRKGSTRRIKDTIRVWLDKNVKETLNEVISILGPMPPEEVVGFVYSLPAVILSETGQMIEFQRILESSPQGKKGRWWEHLLKSEDPKGPPPAGKLDPLFQETRPLRESVKTAPPYP